MLAGASYAGLAVRRRRLDVINVSLPVKLSIDNS